MINWKMSANPAPVAQKNPKLRIAGKLLRISESIPMAVVSAEIVHGFHPIAISFFGSPITSRL